MPCLACRVGAIQVETEALFNRLEEGESIAPISGACAPLISGPGYRLVAAARFGAVGGPGGCGPGHGRFTSPGFFRRDAARRRTLEELADEPAPAVFYEAPHRILETHEDIGQILGPHRVVLARELTKIHDEFFSGEEGALRRTLALGLL